MSSACSSFTSGLSTSQNDVCNALLQLMRDDPSISMWQGHCVSRPELGTGFPESHPAVKLAAPYCSQVQRSRYEI